MGGTDSDSALEAAMGTMATRCERLTLVRFDCTARPHHVVVASLALPAFERLRSLTIACHGKGGGLRDSELEVILSGRTALETLQLRNCEGLSEGLFPRWCNRGERLDEAEAVQQLDQALLSSLGGLGSASGLGAANGTAPLASPLGLLADPALRSVQAPSRQVRRQREP